MGSDWLDRVQLLRGIKLGAAKIQEMSSEMSFIGAFRLRLIVKARARGTKG